MLRRAKSPFALLAATTVTAGVLSALFVNDVICLILTPLVVAVLRHRRLNPVPYLIAVAYAAFTARLAPVALLGLILDGLVLAVVYRRALFGQAGPPPEGSAVKPRRRPHRPLLWKSLVVTGGMLVAFFAGAPIAVGAVGGAATLLAVANVKPAKIYRQVDWGLLVLFAGLFIVLGGLEASGLVARAFAWVGAERLQRVLPLSLVSVVLSNLVSNVPAVILFRSVIHAFPDPQTAWLALAMSSTFAGNLTLIGSVANLIVVEQARAQGAPEVTFLEYLKVGVPVTVLTVAVGTLVLSLS